MKTMAVFGGSGGLGTELIPLLKKKYKVIAPKSREVDITILSQVRIFFNTNDIDIVLNLTGKKHEVYLGEVEISDLHPIMDLFSVNLMGNINILSACLPKMAEKEYGRVIAISSIFAELNTPRNGIYSASKAFLDRLMGVANRENIKHGITCNTIQLGYWGVGMCDQIAEPYRSIAKEKIGLKRWGHGTELYNTIRYIIENEYVCGTNLRIDGGL